MRKPHRKLRRAITAVLGVLLFVVGWYTINRAISPWNAVRLFDDPGSAVTAGAVTAKALDDNPPGKSLQAGDASQDVANQATKLRILIYNIAHGRGLATSNWDGEARRTQAKRLADIAELLVEQNAEVVVLNEVDFDCAWSGHINQAEMLAKQAGYRYRVEQRNLDMSIPFASLRLGNAILSRHPIVSHRLLRYPTKSTWERWLAGAKDGLACVIQLPSPKPTQPNPKPAQNPPSDLKPTADRKVQIVAIHLEHRDEATRLATAKQLLKVQADAAADDIATILAGDFNSTPVSYPHAQPVRDDATHAHQNADASPDTKATAQPGKVTAIGYLLASGSLNADEALSRDQAASMTFPADAPDRLIDWILYPKPWRSAGGRVLASDLSDHRPVVLDLWKRSSDDLGEPLNQAQKSSASK